MKDSSAYGLGMTELAGIGMTMTAGFGMTMSASRGMSGDGCLMVFGREVLGMMENVEVLGKSRMITPVIPNPGGVRNLRNRAGLQMRVRAGLGMTLLFLLVQAPCLFAETKTWDNADGAGEWQENANWFPEAAPTSQDDVVINAVDSRVTATQTFQAKTVTLGGHQASVLETQDFVSGTIDPGNSDETAVLNRRDGHLILKGDAGTVRLKGKYKSSEESMAEQPSFVFYVK